MLSRRIAEANIHPSLQNHFFTLDPLDFLNIFSYPASKGSLRRPRLSPVLRAGLVVNGIEGGDKVESARLRLLVETAEVASNEARVLVASLFGFHAGEFNGLFREIDSFQARSAAAGGTDFTIDRSPDPRHFREAIDFSPPVLAGDDCGDDGDATTYDDW